MALSEDAHASQIEWYQSITASKPFFGQEFLTWLWFRSESGEDQVNLTGSTGEEYVFDLWIDDRLILESSTARAHHHTIRGGDPSQSAEAATALLTGKSVKELKMGINVEGYGEYQAVLSGKDLAPRSLSLPDQEDASGEAIADPLELIQLRLEQMRVFLDILDGLFLQFISERTEDSWES